jgi:glucose/arabinose dehydrogenase
MKLPAVPRLLIMSLVLAACGTPPPSPSTTPAASVASPTQPASGSQSPASSAAPSSIPSPAVTDEPPPLALEVVGDGFEAPIGIESSPDGGLMVNERSGRVIAVDPATGATSVTLDLTDRVLAGGEQGLLGLALHPDWPTTTRAFVHYTGLEGETVLAEYTVSEPPLPIVLDPSSERVLLRVDQPYANHNGGQLAFGPDGHLYLGLGDGGSGGDPHGHGQDPTTLLGSILRLDVDTPPAEGAAYAIPDDNPFADGAGGLPEIYVIGLRNPWRFSFDAATGDLWVADVGQNAWEEVTRLPAGEAGGANLGWNVMEASHCFADPGCDPARFTGPITEYGHDAGCSVTGGHVYRGEAIPGLAGWYVFGDYCSGTVFGIPSDATELIAPRVLLQSGMALSAFGEGDDGELYVADVEAGTLSRIVAGD